MQNRLNHLTVLHVHKDKLDTLDEVAKAVIAKCEAATQPLDVCDNVGVMNTSVARLCCTSMNCDTGKTE